MAGLVSVIIPAYYAQSTIGRAVRSIMAQTYAHWETIIVSDDGQDYGIILKECGINDPRVRFAHTGGIGTGVSSARNTGLKAAAGDIIAILDADDAFYPAKLERMVPFALEYGLCCCAFHYVRYEQDTRRLIKSIGMGEAEGLLKPSNYLDVHYSANAMLVFDRNRIPVQWLENLPVMEDLVFAMTSFDHVPAVYHVNEPLHEYIYSENSLSTSPAAPARFIAAKQRILDMLHKGTLGMTEPDAVAAFRRFIMISLETEREYAESLQKGSAVTFTELLEQRLAR